MTVWDKNCQTASIGKSFVTQGANTTRRHKDEIYWKVLNAAIGLDFRKGHQRWTISELSRTSKVTRSLIYYYFGNSRANILQEAVQLIGEALMGLSEERIELWKQGRIFDSVMMSREVHEKTPYLGAFYLAHRLKDNDIGAAMRGLEDQYFKKMETFLPHLSADRRLSLFGIFFGLVFAPHLSQAAVKESVQMALDMKK